MNNANNLVGEPIGTGALENEFKEAVAERTEHEHDPDAKTKHGIDAPVDQGHKEKIKGFITQEGNEMGCRVFMKVWMTSIIGNSIL